MIIDSILQKFIRYFKGCIMTCIKSIDASLIHVKTDGFIFC